MLPLTQKNDLPTCSGIYRVLDDKGIVIYIGKAKNIRQRWKNGHHKEDAIKDRCGINAKIDWTELPEWLLNRAEHAAVAFYKPVLNEIAPPIV